MVHRGREKSLKRTKKRKSGSRDKAKVIYGGKKRTKWKGDERGVNDGPSKER
jgi:hypothetical protein